MSEPSKQVLAVAVAAFVAVAALRLAVGSGADAVSVLYVVPIALVAIRSGLPGGLWGMGVAIWLLAGTSFVGDDPTFTYLGFLSRVGAFTVVGLGVGTIQDRRLHAEAEADRLQTRLAALEALHARAVDELTRRAEPCDVHLEVLLRVVEAKRALERNDRIRAFAILETVGGSATELSHALKPRPDDGRS